MTEKEFLNAKEKGNNCKYTSMQYVDYEAVDNYDILLDNDKVIVMFGFNKESKTNEYHWASNTAQDLLNAIGTKNNVVLVHRSDNGEIVGITCTATYSHESEKGAIVWIREVAVDPAYQRQGIARKLILQALDFGKKHGATRAYLAADECNEHAIQLYTSIGFESDKDEVEINMISKMG